MRNVIISHNPKTAGKEIDVTNIDKFKNELKEKLNTAISINREKFRKFSLEDRQKQEVYKHLLAYNKVSARINCVHLMHINKLLFICINT